MSNKNTKEDVGHNVLILGNKCYRCGHKWIPREEERPAVCPRCKSPYWDKPKTKFTKNDKKKK